MTAVALLRAAGNGLAKRAANASAGVAAAAQQVRAPAAIARAVQIFTGIVLPQPPWDGGDGPPSLRDARTTDPAHPLSLASPSLFAASLREKGSLGR